MIWGITMAVLAACEQPEATSSTPQLNISATNLTTNAPLAFHDNCLDSVSKGENIVFQIEIRSPYNPLLDFQIQYDEKDAIGKRYRRQDAIGTPYCITVDTQTLEDNTVTVRERDSMQQERMPIENLCTYIHQNIKPLEV